VDCTTPSRCTAPGGAPCHLTNAGAAHDARSIDAKARRSKRAPWLSCELSVEEMTVDRGIAARHRDQAHGTRPSCHARHAMPVAQSVRPAQYVADGLPGSAEGTAALTGARVSNQVFGVS